MYGTVGLVKVKRENQQKLVDAMNAQGNTQIPGFNRAYMMYPENHDDQAVLVVFFDDKDSYWKNANDPEQDKRYREFAQYFDSEPVWHDGEWVEQQ